MSSINPTASGRLSEIFLRLHINLISATIYLNYETTLPIVTRVIQTVVVPESTYYSTKNDKFSVYFGLYGNHWFDK